MNPELAHSAIIMVASILATAFLWLFVFVVVVIRDAETEEENRGHRERY